MKRMYLEDIEKEKEQPEGLDAYNMDLITNFCANGVFKNNVDFEKDLCINTINKKTAGIGTLIKPFTIMAETAQDNGMPATSAYYTALANYSASTNYTVLDNTIAEHLRYPILNAFVTAIGLLKNEFEGLSDSLIESMKLDASTFVDSLVYAFRLYINPDIIFKYLVERVGFEKMNYLYTTSNNDCLKDNPKANNEFRLLVYSVSDPFISLFSADATSRLTDYLYDKIYIELLAELDYTDFHTVCEYIKPIIFSFRNDIMSISSDMLYKLIKYRLTRNPVEIYNDWSSLNKDTDKSEF